VVTLDNGDDDPEAHAKLLLDQATGILSRTNQAQLPESAVSTYQQANELVTEAKRAMADRDYAAASSLAEKAFALASQLAPQK
jgi:hypothetical protein